MHEQPAAGKEKEKSIRNDETTPILHVYDNNQEKWYTVASQLVFPFMIAGFGMVAAGLLLEHVKELKVFREITEIYILVPALLDLKGNLEMTLASRLSTQANIGNMDKICKFKSLFIGNIVLIQLQAIVIGFLAAIVSIFISWLSQDHFNVRHALVLCSSSISTAAIASLGLSLIMIIVIVLSHRCKINPDNIATPVAASLGDITTLAVLAGVSNFLFQIINYYSWVPMMTIVFFLTLIPIWIIISARNEHVKDVLIHGWSPIIIAMFISSTGGLILAFAVQTLRGVCGNLVTVQASRLSTALHQQGKPGEFHNDEQCDASTDCPNPYKMFCSRNNASCIVRLLLFMAIPGHLTFLLIIWQLAANHNQITFLFIFLYLIAALIQVAILLYIAQWIVPFVWRRHGDPDNVCIPYLTSTGDLLGTALLTCVFLLLA
ncbi:unnamed protein product [Rotaria sp. Silwood2]|nr:unnamed protein product [Rotaria sp. Silwood2]CAF4324212.1 unnamed protein product [Rotaria sp. Silwood2]CAF4343819.1 unnamed protein product [Rotaria sp. Silwood2]